MQQTKEYDMSDLINLLISHFVVSYSMITFKIADKGQ